MGDLAEGARASLPLVGFLAFGAKKGFLALEVGGQEFVDYSALERNSHLFVCLMLCRRGGYRRGQRGIVNGWAFSWRVVGRKVGGCGPNSSQKLGFAYQFVRAFQRKPVANEFRLDLIVYPNIFSKYIINFVSKVPSVLTQIL